MKFPFGMVCVEKMRKLMSTNYPKWWLNYERNIFLLCISNMDDFVQVGKGERFSDWGEMGCGEFERERD